MTLIIMAGGAGESPYKEQFLDRFLRRHITRWDKIVRIKYPASIGPVNLTPNPIDFTESAKQSREICAKTIAQLVKDTDDVPIVCGYSLGAWGVSLFLERMATGEYRNRNGTPLELKGAVLVGNPRRARTRGGGPYGIAGEHKPYPKGLRYADVAAIDDGIPMCPERSIMRLLPYAADVLTLNVSDPKTVQAWMMMGSALADLRRWTLPTQRDLFLIQQYLNQVGHVQDYFKPEYISQAAHIFR